MNQALPDTVTQQLANVRRVVIKVGTSLIDHAITRFNYSLVFDLTQQLYRLRQRGVDVLLVSSGAVGQGMRVLGLEDYPDALVDKQALAAIGQPFLMHQYGDVFTKFGLRKAQVLLTREGFEDRRRYLHARDCLERLLEQGVIPIINENDTVVVDELRFGDNDQLSAMVATKVRADLLLILTDVDGLYSTDPRTDPDAELLEVVDAVTPELLLQSGGTGTHKSTGGMRTKVLAARMATTAGILTGFTNGNQPGAIENMLAGKARGTWFLPGQQTSTSRRRWMAGRRPAGTITIDTGAVRALLQKGKSLLPVGVTAVQGTFAPGDLVRICDGETREIALGIVSYSSSELEQAKGRSSDALEPMLAEADHGAEVVHRDNMVVLPQKNGHED